MRRNIQMILVVAAMVLPGCSRDATMAPPAGLEPSMSVSPGLHLRDDDTAKPMALDTAVMLDDTIRMSLAAGNGKGPGNSSNVAWKTTDASIVSISPKQGTVIAVARSAGDATVSASLGANILAVTFHVAGPPGHHYVVTAGTYTPAAGASVAMSAQLVDAGGNSVAAAGRLVTWTSTNGGSFSPPPAFTNGAGVATATFTTSTTAGTSHVVSATDNFGLSNASAAIVTQTGPAANMVSFAGDAQTATTGSAAAIAPAARITDQYGNPVSGAAVTFAVGMGGGAVTGGSATSDANGIAAAGSWRMGTVPGPNTLVATSTGLASVTFAASATPGASAQLAVTAQPSANAQAGAKLMQQPAFQLQDGFGNSVPQAGVAITASIATGAGTLAGGLTVLTDASGSAHFSDLRVDGATGPRTLRFDAGVLTARSTLINIGAGAASRLVITQQPSASAAAGVVFGQQPGIQVEDNFGNPVLQSGVAVSARIESGGGTLLGAASVATDANGIASFNDLAIGGAVATRTLGFSSTGVTGVASSGTLISAGALHHIDVTVASADVLIDRPVKVTAQLRDAYSNAVERSGVSVTWTSTNGATFSSNQTTTGTTGQTTVDMNVSDTPGIDHRATATAAGASGQTTVITYNTVPKADPESYDVIGNVTLVVAAPGLLDGDVDPDGQTLRVFAGTLGTANGGTVKLNANGSFTYLSAPGFNGEDSFVYTMTDGYVRAVAKVTLTVSRRFWYVDNTANAPGDGRDASPFTALADVENVSLPNDSILVRYGNGTSAGYNAGITLKNGQGLIGQGITSSLITTLNGNSVTLLAAGRAPIITNTGVGPTVRLAAGNIVTGLDVRETP